MLPEVEEVEALPSERREFLRELVSEDLFVLSRGVLRYPDVNKRTHGKLCRFIQHDDATRRLTLLPRGHLKSTIVTIADSIRLALRDPNETRILIASETATQADKFLKEIKNHWEKNPLLRALFPELVPEKFSGPGVQWSKTQATIRRQSVYREPTWQTIGVGGAVVGAHFTRIKADDLIGLDAKQSLAKMQATKEWNATIEPLLVDQNTDMIDWVGTRWSRNDLYAELMESYGSRLRMYTRQAIEGGEIIFPQKHSWEEYQHLQENRPELWFSQYCNNPVAGGKRDFPIEALKSFQFGLDARSVHFGDGNSWRLDELDLVITADPNSGSLTAEDMAAIVVSGVSPDDEIFVLQAWSGRVTPSRFVDKIFSLARRWRPRLVGIEKAGQQNTQHYFEKKMENEERHFRVVPLKPKNRDKEERIRTALEPIIKSGRLHLLTSATELRGQISAFPDNDLIDELDALAYGTEIWRKPLRYEDQEENKKALEVVLHSRNLRTGY